MPKKNYKVRVTSYKKQPTGEIDTYGRKKYFTVGQPVVKVIETNYKTLKQDAYKKAKASKGTVFANYRTDYIVTPKKRLVSVTEKYQDGSKKVSYFGGCTKCKN